MKKRLLPFFLLIFINSTYAQDSSFQLKDYKYRTPGFTALELNLGFSGSVSDIKSLDPYQKKQSNWQLFPSDLDYYHYISTDKRIHSSVIKFMPAGSYNSYGQKDTTTKTSDLRYNVYWNFTERFYRKNNWFLELGNTLKHSLATSKSKYSNYDYTNNYLFAENTFRLGFGKGRIENVTDAQTALYILNDLEQQGLLNNSPNPQLTTQFAQLITAINNKRVFDNRRKRIYEFTQIDSFLKTSGLISVNDIRYFTSINDNWVMAYNPYRLSGANWYIHVSPGGGITTNNSYNKADGMNNYGKHKITHTNLTPLIGYENYKPVNLKWQRNFMTTMSFQKNWNRDEIRSLFYGSEFISKSETKEWKTRLYSMYGWGYFPNNRTAINASVQLDASLSKTSDPLLFKEMRIIQPGIVFSADYFLSYRTRLTAFWGLNYKSTRTVSIANETFKGHEFSTGIYLGLAHAIL